MSDPYDPFSTDPFAVDPDNFQGAPAELTVADLVALHPEWAVPPVSEGGSEVGSDSDVESQPWYADPAYMAGAAAVDTLPGGLDPFRTFVGTRTSYRPATPAGVRIVPEDYATYEAYLNALLGRRE